ncbi:MASE4 domain-containing protein [Burkholderia sp. Ac-20365]|uniref:MASE4 domain-containing protein n=1 Tax=Burkholderia sp. Ac-20365 TaxID=2703897 RepID=UPI00197BC36B|nr:MASE4 domain-containing protein [Burkholderia sp. Ac-20365]MBN3765244.1 GHKL domain-containing protein [Burkholderia sp. Ac-20365]
MNIAPHEQHLFLSDLSPGPTQKRLAVAVVLALLVAICSAAGPLAKTHLGRIDAFIPAYTTAMFVTGSITAIVLFAQFSILRSSALLLIASGYLFTSLMLIPWMLTFPGVLAPTGLLGAGLQSTPWIYTVSHVSFPFIVTGYALLKDAEPTRWLWRGSARAAIFSSVVASVVVACGATYLVINEDARMPRLVLDPIHLSPLWPRLAAGLVFLDIVALAVLWFRSRSVLDLWLKVVLCAYVIEVSLLAFPVPVRFTFGWYVARISALLSACLVLFVLLYEVSMLYTQLVRADLAQRREREARLLTGDAIAATIAHEVRQPLAAIVLSAQVGTRWLNLTPPDLDEAKMVLKQIEADGRRADAVVERVRVMFRKKELNRVAFELNSLVPETVALVRGDLQRHGITVRLDLNERLPQVTGDPIQLQQVLLNLITNAIDSMANRDEPRILEIKSGIHENGHVKILVADTGTGVESHDASRIFDPLFTRKPHGMGMGLSICRSIIEAHNGKIWFSENQPRGTVFQFVVVANEAMSAGPSEADNATGSASVRHSNRGEMLKLLSPNLLS